MREHPEATYAAAGVLLLLIVWWGPTPATRQIWPVLGFAVLFAIGVTFLRRQAAAEFPDAQRGEAMRVLRGTFDHHPATEPARTQDAPSHADAPSEAPTAEQATPATASAGSAPPADGPPA
jgi:hypothetical protein